MKMDITILNDFKDMLIDSLPQVAGILGFIIAGWLFLKIILFVISRFLKFSRIEIINKKINEIEVFQSSGLKVNISKIIIFFVKWIIILALLILGSDIFGLTKISEEVGKIVSYLPTLFTAIAIFFGGSFLASYAQKSVKGVLKSFNLSGSNSIANIIFYAILIITVIIALNQLGINTDIITDNLSIILAALLLALSIALGLGSRDVIQRLLFGFYTRKNLQIGQKVIIDGIESTILSIDNICLIVQNEKGKIVYPIKKIVNKKIEIID